MPLFCGVVKYFRISNDRYHRQEDGNLSFRYDEPSMTVVIEDTTDKRTPEEILAEIETLDNEAADAMAAIKELL